MWKYKGKTMTSSRQFPEGATGFIYIMTMSDGKQYIGRKSLYSKRKKPFGKKALAEVTDKRKKKYEIVVKESDWAKYNSSNKTINNALREGKLEITNKEIIKICFTDKQMTYFETQALFCYGVLEHPENFYNDNILGKFYKRDLTKEDENLSD